MTQLPKISLNEKWRYRFGTSDDVFSQPDLNDADWEWTQFTTIPIPELSPPDVVWLRKRFDIKPAETCLRYFLRCDTCVYPLSAYLRGEEVLQSEANAYIDVDVTDELMAEDNVLGIAIYADNWDLSDQTEEIYLQPVFCEDVD